MKVAAIVLAAGASIRLGQPKQLVELNGERLLDRAIRVSSEARCHPVIVVLGACVEQIQAVCKLANADVILNQDWREGMSSSIRTGISALPEATEGLLLLTCDQPALTASHLRSLVAVAQAQGNLVAVASSYADTQGVPAFCPAILFHRLLEFKGDRGARCMLESALDVHLPLGELDVDTPESLQRARQIFEQG